MKSPGTIRHKLSQVRYRYLKKQIEDGLRPHPHNCMYNAALPVEEEPQKTRHGMASLPGLGGQFATCIYGVGDRTSWRSSVCDERYDGGQRARTCPMFCPRRTKDEIKTEFRQDLGRRSLPEIAALYPDMAALLWVLDEEDLVAEDIEVADDLDVEVVQVSPDTSQIVVSLALDPTPDVETPPIVKRSWWELLFSRWLRW